jgi:hypothetical protein
MPKRERYTYYRVDASAECADCSKRWESRNAQAVGARHFEATGHTVHVEVNVSYTYRATPREEPQAPPKEGVSGQ